ncbi:glycosyltransferase WbuB [Halobacteriales archaeon QS_8_69_26]|nr:MAG: glycosyltransferase WbuB [Halobacteriales archaeon QS_8_69_26]
MAGDEGETTSTGGRAGTTSDPSETESDPSGSTSDSPEQDPDPTSEDREYLLVTEYFHPDTASTGQLVTELAVGLKERGLDVRVATGQPNYHSGDNERQPRRSTHEGVPVGRIRAPQVRQSSLPRRLFNWAVFTAWMAAALAVSRPGRPRTVFFVSNPPILPVAMWLVCRLRGWEYTYVVYDLYPDQPVELGYLERGGVLERVWRRLNAAALRDAGEVVALGPVMRERIAERSGRPEETITVVHNWADGEFVRPQEKSENPFAREHDLVDTFTVLYSGNVGEFHDLATPVRAAAEFDPDELRLLVIGEGDGKDDVVALAEDLGVRGGTVEFLPYQPRERLPDSLTAGDVSLVAVEEGFAGVCVSSKLYTALAAGTPVLAVTAPDSDEARIVEGADAGVAVPQGDVSAAVEAIEHWRSDPVLVDEQGRNARGAFEARYTRERAIDEYYDLLAKE